MHAQEADRQDIAVHQRGPTPILLRDLPEPPESIAALIKSANVRMEVGRRPEVLRRVDPSSQAKTFGTRKLLGETRYRISFHYRSGARWRANGNAIRIAVKYSQIKWKPTHVIWFRDMPSTDSFWTDSLVLHEFDHVRISSDPRFGKEFIKRLRDQPILNRTPQDRRPVNQAWVDQVVEEHVSQVFEEVSELVSIRYKELDRVTDHGRREIPEDSPMAQFLHDKTE